ncbi:MAG TPA: MFS transporter [Anaerolineales bacterium]|nr:MFS transporter [Anaerolineales bacterium]
MPSRFPAGLRGQLAAFSFSRMILNTGFRMVYPFLPAIARGLGLDLATAALAVTARSATGLASPLLGFLADRFGPKLAMLAGLLTFAFGLALVFAWPTFTSLVIGLCLNATAKVLFDPSMQAYLGERVRYEQRGLAIAITEFGWSGAFLLGMPIVAWLIARGGWSAPFPFLAGLALVATAVLWRLLPADDRPSRGSLSPLKGLRIILARPSAVAMLGVGLLASAGNEAVSIVYGAWLEQSFGLEILALGAASAIVGLAELCGEGLVASFSDRIGKRRATLLGLGLNSLASIALPLTGPSIGAAFLGLFAFYFTFEFTLVSAIPLLTEQVPEARASMMASNVAALALGRSLGAFLGPQLLVAGLLANCLAAAAFDLLAMALLALRVRE